MFNDLPLVAFKVGLFIFSSRTCEQYLRITQHTRIYTVSVIIGLGVGRNVNNLGIKNNSIVHIPGYKKTLKVALEARWLQLKALTVRTHTLLKHNKLLPLTSLYNPRDQDILHYTHFFARLLCFMYT